MFNSLGYYGPARALLIRGSSRYHPNSTVHLKPGGGMAMAPGQPNNGALVVGPNTPKPEAVAEHRSPYKPISTKVPGMRFTELLSETARVADKLAVVRSMYHPKAGASGHGEGTQYLLSGAHPGSAVPMPDLGSVALHVLGTEAHFLPPYIMVPGNHEQNAVTSTGFLPASTKAFKTGGSDLSAPNWKVGAKSSVSSWLATAWVISRRACPAFTHHNPATASRICRPSDVK